MKKDLIILAVVLVLASAGLTQAASERLDTVAEAYEAQQEKCQFSSRPMTGNKWLECEQYLYELAHVAGANNQTARALEEQIIELIKRIGELNNLLGLTN